MIIQLLTTACDNYMALQYDWMEFGNTNQLSVLLTAYFFPPTFPPPLISLTRQPQAHKYDLDSSVLQTNSDVSLRIYSSPSLDTQPEMLRWRQFLYKKKCYP